MAVFRLSPAWVLDGCEVHGGDDARFLISAPTLAARFAGGAAVDRSDIPDGELEEFEQLRSAGVIAPELTSVTGRVALLGDPFPEELQENAGWELAGLGDADLAVVVRHRSTHLGIAHQVLGLELPHLYVDIAFHHTVSIGPLVIPHETPCISCLYGRLNERWGDREPPSQPGVVTDYGPLAAALICVEVKRCLQGDTSLVGWTVAWDLRQRRVMREKLLTVPACPYCQEYESSGVIPL
ncbi:hypothetical protein [Arachnia rubra]|jgi:hypothetical protein|uniref:TOMM leader peptide-binding protein n=1 Tax=Arachnia rubra TaxID=1547448 RepID=A0ABX7Y5Y2_9ACTN|nr:hypothetical protein [Arachnia rubra]MBB1571593.1 hypothetical protein [Propionibacterium sp.]MDO4646781.1 hypothetical protein [Propionibacteriaceae bacterium]MBB1577602.1 hypothetical protein [Propionibacterium sp.]QUC07913.1 hypothetical protein J5A65_13515 [Arachnia rubra]BCR82259.1 hypothetical protein SK1NUM_27020 [Arachnia rubra]